MPLRKVAARDQTHAQTQCRSMRLPLAPCRTAARASSDIIARVHAPCAVIACTVIFRAEFRSSSRRARIVRDVPSDRQAAARAAIALPQVRLPPNTASGGGIFPISPPAQLNAIAWPRRRWSRRPRAPPAATMVVGTSFRRRSVSSRLCTRKLAALVLGRLAALALAGSLRSRAGSLRSLRSRECSLRSQGSLGWLAALAALALVFLPPPCFRARRSAVAARAVCDPFGFTKPPRARCRSTDVLCRFYRVVRNPGKLPGKSVCLACGGVFFSFFSFAPCCKNGRRFHEQVYARDHSNRHPARLPLDTLI